jgi:hypothetical protein
MAIAIRRRQLILALSGAAAAWPFTVRAQQGAPTRRVGVLQVPPENDANFRSWRTLFVARLRELGWTDLMVGCRGLSAGTRPGAIRSSS